jgi:predicted membrane metal-binding protein
VNKSVSAYMREMQRRSAEARWNGLSSEEKRAKMSALAKARWAKTKRKPKRPARRSNGRGERPGPKHA